MTSATTRRFLPLRELRFGFGIDVMDVDRLPVDYSTAGHRVTIDGQRHYRERSVRGHHSKNVILNTENLGIYRVTQPGSILRHHIQHRLDVRRRAGNYAQDFTRRGLLL